MCTATHQGMNLTCRKNMSVIQMTHVDDDDDDADAEYDRKLYRFN